MICNWILHNWNTKRAYLKQDFHDLTEKIVEFMRNKED